VARTASSPSNRRLTRRESKQLTRQRLIDAAVDLLRSEGVAALTTGRIAARAGIAQPSFYGHFASLEEFIDVAAGEIGARARRAMHAERRRMVLADARAAVRATYEAGFDVFLRHRPEAEILLRYRHEPTALGRALQAVVAGARGDLVADMRSIGLDEHLLPNLELHGELVVAMTLAALEAVIEKRAERKTAIDVLVVATLALIESALSGRARENGAEPARAPGAPPDPPP
jgi:AcrR family transcriptional regulator